MHLLPVRGCIITYDGYDGRGFINITHIISRCFRNIAENIRTAERDSAVGGKENCSGIFFPDAVVEFILIQDRIVCKDSCYFNISIGNFFYIRKNFRSLRSNKIIGDLKMKIVILQKQTVSRVIAIENISVYGNCSPTSICIPQNHSGRGKRRCLSGKFIYPMRHGPINCDRIGWRSGNPGKIVDKIIICQCLFRHSKIDHSTGFSRNRAGRSNKKRAFMSCPAIDLQRTVEQSIACNSAIHNVYGGVAKDSDISHHPAGRNIHQAP